MTSNPQTESIESILRFWFSDELTGEMGQPQSKRWFLGGSELDVTIKQRFEQIVLQAASGALDHWCDSAEGSLALILLYDQFPRNIWRGQAQAFAYTDQALSICNEGIERGFPALVDVPQRVFFYMPLEHHESMESQRRVLSLFEKLRVDAPESLKDFAQGTLDFAQTHADIIESFGRYPYRNEVLGRSNTQAEEAWLEQSSSRFGQ